VNTDRPLDGVASIKVKLGLLVGASVVVAVVVAGVGEVAEVPWWMSVPVTVAAALAVTQWLARGMTSPLREMTAAARRMAAGDYAQRVTATSTDEVGTLGRAFNAMAADLAAADQQRRQLVATVSHELRTPLTAQRALLENLVDGVVSPGDDALRAALTQSERLSSLVGDLLDLSRIDAGAAPLALQQVQVSDLLRAGVAEAQVGGRSVAVRHQTDPADLTVTADPGRLAQLVANLVDNAVRHSPPHGEVRLSARAVDEDTWWLEVCDDGPGIPADRLERVFDRFGSGGDSAGGTGLGLAIASWVCELHGGTIAALPTPTGTSGAHLRAVLPRRARAGRPTHLQEDRTVPTSATPTEQMPPAETAALAPPPAPRTAGPAGGGGAFEGLWPERGVPVQPMTVLAALGIGAWAAVTWPQRNVGLAVTLTMLAAGLLMWVVARHRRNPWTIACAVLAGLLASTTMLRDSGGVVPLAVLAGVVVAAAGTTLARTLLSVPFSVAAWPASALRGLPLLGRTITATTKVSKLWPVLRTIGFSLVALALFGGLFASGDALFGSWAKALVPDLGWDTIVTRTFVLVLVAGVALTGAYLALNPPPVADLALPQGRRATHRWEWAVPVGVVVALFAGFLVAQAAAMWGGHDYLQRTTGLTYAEYVHQGFGQLTVATFLTVIVVGLTMRRASRATPRDRLLLRLLLGALCVLTLAVVASALYRMSLYQEAFGYTVLRVFVDGFELWLGLVVVFLLVAGVKLSGWWVPRAVLVSAAVFTLGFAAMNPDAWVAGRNIDRYDAGKPLDTLYLSTLSADASPVIAQRLPADVAGCVLGDASSGGLDGADLEEDALSWNLGRARADDAIAALGPAPTSCTGLVTDQLTR
jgi:two-component system, OmpR family, sensor histidine kinase BaeS